MKQAEVIVGEVYVARISGGLAKVKVLARTEDHKGRTVFEVARPSALHRVLRRGAAALRPVPKVRFIPDVTDEQLRHAAEHAREEAVRDAAQAELERRAAVAAGQVRS